MRWRRVLPTLALAILAPPAGARATFGGPVTVELLGFDPRTTAIYYIEHDGSEALEPPVLRRLPLRGARPRIATLVPWEGIYGDSVDWQERWRAEERRFTAIRERLVPLIALPVGDARVELDCSGHGAARGTLSAPVLVSRPLRLEPYRSCQASVRAIARVPGRSDAIAVVRYVGVPVEGGYDRERVVLARYRSPGPPPARRARAALEPRARIEAFFDPAGEHLARLDLVAVDSGGQARAVTFADRPGECHVDPDPLVVDCTLAGELRVVPRADAVDVVRDGHPIARVPLPASPPPNLAYAVATEQSFATASADVRAICATDWDCRIVVDGATLVLEPMRGRLDCSLVSELLRCTWSHTTRIDMTREHCIDLSRRRPTPCPPAP